MNFIIFSFSLYLTLILVFLIIILTSLFTIFFILISCNYLYHIFSLFYLYFFIFFFFFGSIFLICRENSKYRRTWRKPLSYLPFYKKNPFPHLSLILHLLSRPCFMSSLNILFVFKLFKTFPYPNFNLILSFCDTLIFID